MQHVLNTTTSADSMSSVTTSPSATRAPASRSESCSFIWHPNVRMWKVRGRTASTAPPLVARPPPSVPVSMLTRTRIRPRVTNPGIDGYVRLTLALPLTLDLPCLLYTSDAADDLLCVDL